MAPARHPDLAGPVENRLAVNVVHFVRILRRAGLPLGPERTLAALEALAIVGPGRRDRVHAALSAVLLDRHEDQALFDASFAAFWQDPRLLERFLHRSLPRIADRVPPPAPPPRRLQDALSGPGRSPAPTAAGAPDELRLDAHLSFSDRERLQGMDFESMSADEFQTTLRLVSQTPLLLDPIRLRRRRRSRRGELDLRALIQHSARDPLGARTVYRDRREALPPLVVLCDISGSMQRYARIFLHWAHALTGRLPRVETLTLGTRLTRITRSLRRRDVDQALATAGLEVADWAGGTRLGPCLAAFNRDWARRLLGANATVLLLTDGLDRDDASLLGREARRLAGFAHQVIWLNPLLRFDGFEPRASGIRALLPHVDRMIPAHNLNSLADLVRQLSRPGRHPWN